LALGSGGERGDHNLQENTTTLWVDWETGIRLGGVSSLGDRQAEKKETDPRSALKPNDGFQTGMNSANQDRRGDEVGPRYISQISSPIGKSLLV